ncbi:MAG: MurR/RpiR family transcriptional regulator [Dongiaceae bacterium]
MSPRNPLKMRLQARSTELGPAVLRVAQYIAAHREEALVSSAASLAMKLETSDATIVRTAKALGYSGLNALRRDLADELRHDLSPANRVARTLEEVKGNLHKAFEATLDLHLGSLTAIRDGISPKLFQDAVDHVIRADRIAVFGIGPSSAMAEYFAIQVGRFGFDAFTMTDTGLLLADRLLSLRKGDLLLIMAYGRVYPELRALFDRADHVKLPRILMTDTLGAKLAKRSGLVLQIPRGRADTFSMHTATLAFLEILLVGIATQRPKQTIRSLTDLNRLRADVTGRALAL